MLYLSVALLIIIGIYLFDIRGKKKGSKLLYGILLVIFISISGFSYRLGIDMPSYIDAYEYYSSNIFDLFNLRYLLSFKSNMPGWVFLNTFFKSLGLSFFTLNFFHSIIVNYAFFSVISKWAKHLYTGIFLYYIISYCNFNFEILKESLAVAIFFMSIPLLLAKKVIKYYIVVFFAIMFHSSATILLFFPLFLRIRISKKNITTIVIIIILMLFFSSFSISYIKNFLLSISFMSDKINEYLGSESYSHSLIGPFKIFNYIFSIFLPLYLIYHRIDLQGIKKNTYYHLVIFSILIYTFTQFVFFLYRFNNYFSVFFLCFLSDYIKIHSIKPGIQINKMKQLFFRALLFTYVISKFLLFFKPVGGTEYLSYIRYYPYSSVFTKEKNQDREDLHYYRFYY